MEGWTDDNREGYRTKVIETPCGKVTVHRPLLDERTRAQRHREVERALESAAHGGRV